MSKYSDYKAKVLEVSQYLCENGYFGARHGSGGNVSALVEGENAVAVTPSGKPYRELTRDDICIIDLDLNTIEGELNPSIEAPMHLAVYKNRPDVNAVIHTHQPYASVFALLNESIPALFDETTASIGPVAEIVPYGLSGSSELLDNVVSRLGNRCHCYILQNHGALSIASSLDRALHFTELLEKTAQVYWAALATGRPVTPLAEPFASGLFQLTMAKQDIEIERKRDRYA